LPGESASAPGLTSVERASVPVRRAVSSTGVCLSLEGKLLSELLFAIVSLPENKSFVQTLTGSILLNLKLIAFKYYPSPDIKKKM
jgi:hypothetical protein